MSILTKQQNLHGITPLYYMLLDEKSRSDFNKIIAYTHFDASVKFIDSLIEYEDFLLRVYIDQNYEGLTDEQFKFLHSNQFVKSMLPAYYGKSGLQNPGNINAGLRYSIAELKEIKEEGIINFKLDGVDLNLGKLDFEQLIKLNPDVIEAKLTAEMHNLALIADNEVDAILHTQDTIDTHEEFIEKLTIAVGLIQKRIDNIENRNKKTLYRSIEAIYLDIAKNVAKIDSMMLGEVNGIRSETALKATNMLKENASMIGLDSSTQLYSEMYKHLSYIKKLPNIKYNHKLVPIYEAKRRVLEKIRTLSSARADTLKNKYKVHDFYF